MSAGEETPCALRKTKPAINGLVFLWTECWVGVVLQMIEYSKASVPFVAVERCCGQLRQHDKRLREGVVVLIAHHITLQLQRSLPGFWPCNRSMLADKELAQQYGSVGARCASGDAAPRFTVPAIGRTACKPRSIQRRRRLSSTWTLSCCSRWMADWRWWYKSS